MHSSLHTPVLLDTIRSLFIEQGLRTPYVVDATLGLGGHASMFCENMQAGTLVGFDRDGENLDRARTFLLPVAPHIEKLFVHSSFSALSHGLSEQGIPGIDAILYDLGVSSIHFDEGDRGFSLRFDGPLDMRYDRSRGKSATDIVMTRDAAELTRIFRDYGEEKKAWFIASEIVKARKTHTIDTTGKLLEIIRRSSYDQKSPLRVFQALRMEVNDELTHIKDSLIQALDLLRPGGIIMVITFHSVEDRWVKQCFAPYLTDTIDPLTGQILIASQFAKYTKKPIIPSEEEIHANPRSRSAKLRVIQKNKLPLS